MATSFRETSTTTETDQCAGAPPHPAPEEIEIAAVLHALSDPIRLRVVAMLASGEERTCSSFGLPVVKSTCTHHFRVLREAGLIRQRCEGKTRLNSLRREDLDVRFPGLIDAVLGAATGDPSVTGPSVRGTSSSS
jgi:DNA-binding transcriptional ArsR family regulator